MVLSPVAPLQPALPVVTGSSLPSFLLETKGAQPLTPDLLSEASLLETVNLQGTTLTDSELESIITFLNLNCPNLKSLNLDRCEGLTLRALISIAKLKNLNTLSIEESSIHWLINSEDPQTVVALTNSCTSYFFTCIERLKNKLLELPPALLLLDAVLATSTRILALTSSNFEKEELPLSESLRIANYCLKNLFFGDFPEAAFERISKHKSGLKYTLYYDQKQCSVYLPARFSKAAFRNNGGFKNIMSTVLFPLFGPSNQPIQRAVQAYTRSKLTAGGLSHCKLEAEVTQKLRGVPGVVQVFATKIYPIKHGPKERVSMLMEAFEIDAFDAVIEQKLQPIHKIQITKGMIYGLAGMHARELYHGDVKLENIFCRFEFPAEQEKRAVPTQALCIAKLGDFGFTSTFDTIAQVNSYYHHDGTYGTAGATSPEMIGKACFSGSPAKVDAYALGIAIYTLFEEHMPLWFDEAKKLVIDKKLTSSAVKFAKHRDRTRDAIVQKITKMLAALAGIEGSIAAIKEKVQRKEPLTESEIKDCGRWLYKNLLVADPAVRFDLAQAKAEIDLLLPGFVVA